MRAYILRRLLLSVPLVFLMTFLVFAVINLNPEAAIQRYILSPTVSFQFIEQEKERMGLYDPLPVRYLRWLGGVLCDVQFGRQTRALLSFADEGALRSTFETSSSWPLPVRGGSLERPGDRLDLTAAIGEGGGWPALAGSLEALSGVWTNAGADPAVLRLRVSGSGPDPAVWETVLRAPPGRPAAWAIRPPDLAERGLRMDAVAAIEFRLESGGPMALDAVRASGAFDVARPRRGRPYARFPFLGDGHEVRFGRLGSPYTRMILPRTDWEPAGKVVAVEDVGGVPTEIVETKGFRSLVLEAGNPLGAAQRAELRVYSGADPDGPPAVFPFTLEPGRRQTVEFSLAELRAGGVRTEAVHTLGLRSRAGGRIYVTRVFLKVDEPALRIGWIPDFGASYENNLPVLRRLGGRVRNTILLVLASMLLTWVVALPFGVLAAVHQYKASDKLLSFVSFIGMALPGFFLAVLVRHLASRACDPDSVLGFLPDLPTSGRVSADHESLDWFGRQADLFRHAVLPILVLGLGGMAGLQRVMRGTLLEVQRQQYILTARAKGLSERVVIYKHALRNAITPFVAGFGSILPGLIGGSALIEIVFNYPGVGQLMLPAVLNRDINLVMGNTLIAALLLVAGNLIADILLAVVDPRVSYD